MSNLCVTGDTELLTEKGYVKAKDLYESQEDLKVVIDNRTKNYDINNKGTDIVNAIPMQLTAKQAEIYEITTKQGFKIKSTEWHKYYRKINDSIEKVQLNQLEVGDKLLVQSGNGSYGDFHDPKLAFLMGLIAGDGTFGRDGSVKIYLYHEKEYLKETIEELVAYIIDKYRNKMSFYIIVQTYILNLLKIKNYKN